MKYYLIAGEASGDLHGSNLIRAIKAEDPEAVFRAFGGDLMEAAGASLARHFRDLAFMGFVEIVQNLPTILRNFRICKKDIEAWQPDVLIFIDYPAFNLPIAKWAKKRGFRTFFYISPQVWAWKERRVKTIRAAIDRLFVILPFETDFYAKHGMEVDFVGHPLLDVIEPYAPPANFREKYHLGPEPIIALLPGSRQQEIRRMLPTMLAMIPHFPDHQFVIAGAPSASSNLYEKILEEYNLSLNKKLHLISNQTYPLLSHARAAMVTSGTATLETALFEVPQVVCYKGNALSYQIAKRLVKVPYISLVNLIADREVVTELIQDDFHADRLQQEVTRLLSDEPAAQMKTDYQELKESLGNQGASLRAAKLMVERLRE
jgi:lipid-A-disaccharide synthase